MSMIDGGMEWDANPGFNPGLPNPTPGAAPKRPAVPRVTPGQLSADANRLEDEAFTKMGEANKERAAETERAKGVLAKDTADLQGLMGQPAPKREEVPLPDPNLGPMLDPKQYQSFAYGMLALAAIGAIGGRKHWQNAASALDGALQGYMKGNMEVARMKKEEFDREFKIAQSKQAKADKQYEDILKSRTLSLNEKFKMIEIHAAEHGLAQEAAAAKAKDYDMLLRLASQKQGRAAQLQATEDKIAEKKRHEELVKALKSGKEDSGMTTEAIADAATQFRKTGVIPSAFRDQHSRALVQNEAAKQRRELGISADEELGNRVDYKAIQSAYTAVSKDMATFRPYERMLEKNGDIAIQLGEKAIATDARFANKTINWLRQNATDNPDVAEFLAQARIVSTEAARVVNNPRIVGQLTDSARHEMDQVISGDMPLDSFTRVMRRLQSDGRNRFSAMQEELNELKGRAGNAPGVGGAAPKKSDAPIPLDAYLKSQGF